MEFQNLQSLLNRATAPSSEEEAKHYCTRFTTLVNQEPDGASRAITLLIAKVQSQNEPVALRAIHVMDQCSKFCGKPFQTQIGKFRFLNELIKLVSPKYAGGQTPVAVRSAIVIQLKLWSAAFKDQPKILEAYNMLEKTGNTKIQTARKGEFTYAAGEDADKAALLAQLLKSKNKHDLETANKMIKDMVAAESRKVEQDAEMLKEVSLIHNNGRLLAEMLANSDRTNDEKLLLDELHKTCVGLRPKLYRLAGQLSDSAQLSSVVEAGETLNRAIEQYEMLGAGGGGGGGGGAPPQITAYRPPSLQGPPSSHSAQPPASGDLESTTLINLEEEVGTSATTAPDDSLSADDFDDFLSAVTAVPSQSAAVSSAVKPSVPIATPNITTASLQTTASNGTMETKSSGLFGGMTLQPQQPVSQTTPESQPTPASQGTANNDFADALGLLSFNTPGTAPTQPQSTNVGSSGGGSLLEDLFSTPNQSAQTSGLNIMDSNQSSGFSLLDPNQTSEFSLLDSSGPNVGGSLLEPTSVFQPNPTTQSQQVEEPADSGNTFDLLMPLELKGASFTKSVPKAKPTLSQLSATKAATPKPPSPQPATALHAAPVIPLPDLLADVEVPLTIIRPSADPPILVFDSGVIRVNLYKTENKPEPDVSVWLITVTNSSTARVDDVDIEMSTSSSGKLKLSAPSSKFLSPFSPICPSSPIQQVLMTTGEISSINYTLKFDNDTKSGTVNLN